VPLRNERSTPGQWTHPRLRRALVNQPSTMRVRGASTRLSHAGEVNGLQAVAAAREKWSGTRLETLLGVGKSNEKHARASKPAEALRRRPLSQLYGRGCCRSTATPHAPDKRRTRHAYKAVYSHAVPTLVSLTASTLAGSNNSSQ
jgi:hypothetical protein